MVDDGLPAPVFADNGDIFVVTLTVMAGHLAPYCNVVRNAACAALNPHMP